MKLRISILISVLAIVSAPLNAQSGREIIQQVKDRPDGDSRYSEMTMTLISKKGKERIRKINSYSMDIGQDKKTLMFFTYPGDVAGTGFLTWDYDQIGKDDDKWLYLPAMKKTRRISGSSAKKDYFMGTDFTYDDMGSRNIDEDEHKLLREEELEGQSCWVIESESKDPQDIFSRKVRWIRKDCLMAVKVVFYDRQGILHRELHVSDVKQVDGFWTAAKLHMTNVQVTHQTLLSIDNPQFNTGLSESSFTVVKLEKGEL
ncbi:MAG: outer membrane lipoprotein-sorting protein [Bacteroidales bacterium]|nr:outer membrane lipoprotein-sorting protein [Bacteroidales bacterium]